MFKLFKAETVNLKSHPEIKEKLIQEKISEDPSILGLGDLEVRQKERTQPHAGRIDLLLQDAEASTRYEVEIQLGKTDESHIIRTIEYWDNERKRFPLYEHVAVIVAEEITSRFFNVISLFNKAIPLIVIQMGATKCGDDIGLTFTTILDLSSQEAEEEEGEPVDREYWIKRGSQETVKMADKLLLIAQRHQKGLQLKYNKFYIGLADQNGNPDNVLIFRPRKSALSVEFDISQSDKTQRLIDKAGLDDMGYLQAWNRYRLRLTKEDLTKNKKTIEDLIALSFDENE